ncbi:hypothetical protein EJ08DRAFT_696233 [Tothia fuscella]|uniref:Uncharacterized protein n=1 Tax=Tothia fuscella TaxID=1048955 RepID=A0A9P4U0B0_9PEZI|nr:hypothetical protein EJ08DRAFT_696233 [Tothia fuscella]
MHLLYFFLSIALLLGVSAGHEALTAEDLGGPFTFSLGQTQKNACNNEDNSFECLQAWGPSVKTENTVTTWSMTLLNASAGTHRHGSIADIAHLNVLATESSKGSKVDLLPTFFGPQDTCGFDNTTQPCPYAIVMGPGTSWDVLDSPADASVPTVPFSLNLGRNGEWEGLAVLGNAYDKARVVPNKPWIQIKSPENFASTAYTKSLDQKVQINGIDHTAEIYFSYASVELPAPHKCNGDVNITFPDVKASIVIPAKLLSGQKRCSEIDPKDANQNAFFGVPLFQAAVAMIDKDGGLWLAQAHNNTIAPEIVQFDPKGLPSTTGKAENQPVPSGSAKPLPSPTPAFTGKAVTLRPFFTLTTFALLVIGMQWRVL